MDKQLARDMAILVTARAAKEAGFDVDDYVERYAGGEEDREYIITYLSLMYMINQTWANWDIWNPDTERFDEGKYIYVWSK